MLPYTAKKNEQMLRYTGFCSNVCRGKRRKQEVDKSDYVIEDDLHNKSCSKSCTRLCYTSISLNINSFVFYSYYYLHIYVNVYINCDLKIYIKYAHDS